MVAQADVVPVADDPGPVENETFSASGAAVQEKGQKKQKKAKPDREVDAKGRIYVRDTIRSQSWTSELGIASARMGIKYRDRVHDLQAEVEAELAGGRAEIRDAYVRIQATPLLRVQAGRSKRPISAISLTSRWDLPVIERGSINDFQLFNELTGEPDELPLGGRTTGVQVQVRDKDLPLEPELTVGIFRSAVHEQLREAGATPGRRPIELSDGFPEDIFSRLEIEPLPWMKAAASFAWVGQLGTAGNADTFRHDVIAGLDVVVERGPLRLWAEGFMGQSPFHLASDRQARGRFVAVRSIVAARLPVRTIYVEPYITGQRLDIRSDLDEDVILQGGGGVNLGLGDAWKLQLGVDHLDVGSRLYGAGTLYLAQIGAAF